jgi:hypothetical protein
LQLTNIFSLKSRKAKVILISIYLALNIISLLWGVGKENYYLSIPIELQMTSILFFIFYNLYLIFLIFQVEKDGSTFLVKPEFALVVNVYFVITLVGSYILPGRFQSIWLFIPFLFIYLILSNITKKYLLVFIIVISLFLSTINNIYSKNSYYLYSYNEFNNVINKLNKEIKNNDTILTLDPAILSQFKNSNLFPFGSPHSFNKNMNYNFIYDGLNEKYPNNSLYLMSTDLFDQILNNKPEIIITTNALPFRPYNYKYPEGLNYLNANYDTFYRSQNIWIFRKKK